MHRPRYASLSAMYANISVEEYYTLVSNTPMAWHVVQTAYQRRPDTPRILAPESQVSVGI